MFCFCAVESDRVDHFLNLFNRVAVYVVRVLYLCKELLRHRSGCLVSRARTEDGADQDTERFFATDFLEIYNRRVAGVVFMLELAVDSSNVSGSWFPASGFLFPWRRISGFRFWAGSHFGRIAVSGWTGQGKGQ